VIDGREVRAGSPISWHPGEIKAGKIDGFTKEGETVEIKWDEIKQNPVGASWIGWWLIPSVSSLPMPATCWT